MTDPFEEHLVAWREWAGSPWGRIRFAVVAHTLARHVGDRPLRVLDVGGGDARDSLPLAMAGHDVTVLDTAPGMLAEARRRAVDSGASLRTIEASLDDLAGAGGGYDLVLCHFVLHYRAPEAGDIARLTGALAPGGRLSLVAPNPAGRVLQALVREGPVAARQALHARTWATATFQHSGRLLDSSEVEVELAAAGLEVVGRYGGRIVNDLLTDDTAKQDTAHYTALEQLEIDLCDRDPYRRFGQFWQLVAQRSAGGGEPEETAAVRA